MFKHIVDRLNEGRERVKKGWTQKTYARSAKRRPVGYRSPKAVQWCIVGSCDCDHDCVKYLRSTVFSRYPDEKSIVTWNDRSERTQEDIIEAYDRAIELAEKDLAQCA